MLTLCISTSSPEVSVAICSGDVVIAAESRSAEFNASGVSLLLLEKMLCEPALELQAIDQFVADCGPGSFTGTRVAISLIKAFAFASGKLAAAVQAFDLIAPHAPVGIPSRKNQYCLRLPDTPIEIIDSTSPGLRSACGYGPAFEKQNLPRAASVASLLQHLEFSNPQLLQPVYSSPPSISQPTVPYRTVSE